jgi:hypothetical protein
MTGTSDGAFFDAEPLGLPALLALRARLRTQRAAMSEVREMLRAQREMVRDQRAAMRLRQDEAWRGEPPTLDRGRLPQAGGAREFR